VGELTPHCHSSQPFPLAPSPGMYGITVPLIVAEVGVMSVIDSNVA
jgi:hypothetical protein